MAEKFVGNSVVNLRGRREVAAGGSIQECTGTCVAANHGTSCISQTNNSPYIVVGESLILPVFCISGLAGGKSIAAVFTVNVPSAIDSLLFDLDYVVHEKPMVSYNGPSFAAIQ